MSSASTFADYRVADLDEAADVCGVGRQKILTQLEDVHGSPATVRDPQVQVWRKTALLAAESERLSQIHATSSPGELFLR